MFILALFDLLTFYWLLSLQGYFNFWKTLKIIYFLVLLLRRLNNLFIHLYIFLNRCAILDPPLPLLLKKWSQIPFVNGLLSVIPVIEYFRMNGEKIVAWVWRLNSILLPEPFNGFLNQLLLVGQLLSNNNLLFLFRLLLTIFIFIYFLFLFLDNVKLVRHLVLHLDRLLFGQRLI